MSVMTGTLPPEDPVPEDPVPEDLPDAPGRPRDISWMSTKEAARRLGITVRTLYRIIDDGDLAAYKLGRVIRLQASDIDAFIEGARIPPGSLEHLYPEMRRTTSAMEPSDT